MLCTYQCTELCRLLVQMLGAWLSCCGRGDCHHGNAFLNLVTAAPNLIKTLRNLFMRPQLQTYSLFPLTSNLQSSVMPPYGQDTGYIWGIDEEFVTHITLVPRSIPSFSMFHAEKRDGLGDKITCVTFQVDV